MSSGYYYANTSKDGQPCFTVFFDDADGNSHGDTDHSTREQAAERVAYLNGSSTNGVWHQNLRALCEGLELENLEIAIQNLDVEGWGLLGKLFAGRTKELLAHKAAKWREKLESLALATGMEDPSQSVMNWDVAGWREYGRFIRQHASSDAPIVGPMYSVDQHAPEQGKKYLCMIQIAKDLQVPQVCEYSRAGWDTPHVVQFAEILLP